MPIDIGEMLFREILGMSAYPGSPFTGNIFQDIILFFFVPTVFLIIFVYVASGIIIAPENGKLRLLFGIAIYAFIIASRYFEGFAIFASQFYFIFVILIGIVYFLGRHFRRPGGGTMAYEGRRGGAMAHEGTQHGGSSGHASQFISTLESDNTYAINDAIKSKENELRILKEQIKSIEGMAEKPGAKIKTAAYHEAERRLIREIEELKERNTALKRFSKDARMSLGH